MLVLFWDIRPFKINLINDIYSRTAAGQEKHSFDKVALTPERSAVGTESFVNTLKTEQHFWSLKIFRCV